MIAVLGTGLLGSGFVRAARGRGETVHVWNRTPAKAAALAAVGAIPCPDPGAAVAGASRVHLVLADDAAVDAVLAQVATAAAPGLLVVDHSTVSPAGAKRRTEAARGYRYVHAPVFMGPGNAEAATGLMLVSGSRERVAEVTPLLTPMTGKLVDLGERVDAAAAFKLMGNWFLMTLTAGFSDLLGLARSMGVAPAEAATLFTHFNPGASVPTRFARMIEKAYENPSWELAMARKDAGLMAAEAAAAGVRMDFLPHVIARMDEVIAEGAGALDWTVLGRDQLPD